MVVEVVEVEFSGGEGEDMYMCMCMSMSMSMHMSYEWSVHAWGVGVRECIATLTGRRLPGSQGM